MYKHGAILVVSYWGAALNGEHFTGTIYSTDDFKQQIEVTHMMTTGLASRLNKKDSTRCYRPGDTTIRFETLDSIIKAGIEVALQKLSGLQYILLGDYVVADPQRMIWCIDLDLMSELNLLWSEFESYFIDCNDPWKLHGIRMEELSTHWCAGLDMLNKSTS